MTPALRVLLAAVSIAVPVVVHAQGHQWSLACDGKGQAHCLRTDYSAGGLLYRHWDGSQWSADEVLSKGTYPFDPAVACDAQDRVHAIWADKANYADNADIFYAVKDEAGWSKPVDITKASGWDCRPSMVILPNGDIHVVYTRQQGIFTTNPPGINGSLKDAPVLHLIYKGGEWTEAAPLLDSGMTYGYLCADPKGQLTGAVFGGQVPNLCVFIRRWKDDGGQTRRQSRGRRGRPSAGRSAWQPTPPGSCTWASRR